MSQTENKINSNELSHVDFLHMGRYPQKHQTDPIFQVILTVTFTKTF